MPDRRQQRLLREIHVEQRVHAGLLQKRTQRFPEYAGPLIPDVRWHATQGRPFGGADFMQGRCRSPFRRFARSSRLLLLNRHVLRSRKVGRFRPRGASWVFIDIVAG